MQARPRGTGATTMRAILLNDTRSENHVGCSMVMRHVLRACERAGIRPLDTLPTSSPDDEAFVRGWAGRIQLVLLNGEGTMHDDQPKARGLARAARWASERGKRVVLFNTVWQNNSELNRLLPHLDLLFCRESLSADEARRAGTGASVVPDMVFAADGDRLPRRCQSAEGLAVLDALDGRLARRLAWRACRCGDVYMPMNGANYERICRRRLLRWALALRCPGSPRPPGRDFLEQLSLHRGAISGRFHGTCLCFLAGVPVASIASNTHKIEGLYLDAGLDPALVMRIDRRRRLPPMSEFNRRIESMRRRSDAVRRYVAEAPSKISEMFRRIRSLAERRDAG